MDRKEEKSIDLDEKSAADKYRLLQAQQLIEQMEALEVSIRDRVCHICGYRVDASEPDDSARELMQDHFDIEHDEAM
jgi:hypothetical protein